MEESLTPDRADFKSNSIGTGLGWGGGGRGGVDRIFTLLILCNVPIETNNDGLSDCLLCRYIAIDRFPIN